MLKLPLRIMKAPERNTPQIVDADNRAILLFTVEEEKRAAALEAIVAAVNGQPALLETAQNALLFRHDKLCFRPRLVGQPGETDEQFNERLYQVALECDAKGCAKIAAAIRAAGGE